ncbi:helix-turn-helix domain-containing protein [Scopulibacillus cellulosilyticus]|uniref:Helix-turn-helix domain-containing protein n=1 Tax=Scopulibacillus cellulosilyticus TaxID=2665665 RepID=A0ABW2PVP9_9BACL
MLYTYLQNGGNLEKTSNTLALSMSGLRYRIQKIEDLLEEDLRDQLVGYQFFYDYKRLSLREKFLLNR